MVVNKIPTPDAAIIEGRDITEGPYGYSSALGQGKKVTVKKGNQSTQEPGLELC